MTKQDIWLIEARTGCTCCASENHYRGPYKTKEDAERRMNFYYKGDFWPLASQYASRGSYSVETDTAYVIEGLIISELFGHVADGDSIPFIQVNEDGSIDTNGKDEFGFEYWEYSL